MKKIVFFTNLMIASLFCGEVSFAMSAPESGRSSQSTKSASVSNIRKSKITESDKEEWFDAAETGNIDKMLSLMGKGIDVNLKKSTWGDTALSIAAGRGHLDIVRMLLLPEEEKVIQLLNIRKNKERVDDNVLSQYLINKNPVIVEKKALAWAAGYGHTEIVRLLLAHGGAYIDYYSKNIALMFASVGGSTEIVRLLFARGGDDIDCSEGALVKAAGHGHIEIVEFLLAHGADVNFQNSKNETALMYAAMEGKTETVKVLLNKGADVNFQNSKNETALMYAAFGGKTETVKVLLDKGADINLNSERIGTALHYAAAQGHVEVITLLLNRGADINVQNRYSETALMSAVENGQTEAVRLLLDRGADINSQNDFGNTALDIAKERGLAEIVSLLASVVTTHYPKHLI